MLWDCCNSVLQLGLNLRLHCEQTNNNLREHVSCCYSLELFARYFLPFVIGVVIIIGYMVIILSLSSGLAD